MRKKHTDTYAHKQITSVVSYASECNVDLRARTLGMTLSKILGVPVIVENKPMEKGKS